MRDAKERKGSVRLQSHIVRLDMEMKYEGMVPDNPGLLFDMSNSISPDSALNEPAGHVGVAPVSRQHAPTSRPAIHT